MQDNYKPSFRIEANGTDITEALRDRLLEIKVTDEAGVTSDRLEITLDDREHKVPYPPKDATFKVWLGYEPPGTLPAYMGSFKLDEVEVGSGPRSMTIRAKAADFSGGYREPKTRSWHDTTVGEIVRKVAAENKLETRVGDELAAIKVAHIDQTEESDAAFLTRIAGQNGAVAKPADGHLLFVKRGEGKTVSGAPAPTFTLRPADVTSWKAKLAERGSFGAVETYWQDHATGERKSVKAGSGETTFRDRLPYASEAEAKSAAESQLDKGESGKATVDLTLPGRPDLFAECLLALEGFRSEVNGSYSIKSVEHSLTTQSYSSRISAEIKGGGGAESDD